MTRNELIELTANRKIVSILNDMARENQKLHRVSSKEGKYLHEHFLNVCADKIIELLNEEKANKKR